MGELKGYMKGRVLPGIPFMQDFEKFELNQDTSKPPPPALPNTVEPPTPFAYPPLPWNAARFKWEIREKDGTKALMKTIEDMRLQRGMIFINRPDLSNYTIEADVLSEGNKRKMSEIGIIDQRYLIVLKATRSGSRSRRIRSCSARMCPSSGRQTSGITSRPASKWPRTAPV